MEQTFMKYLIFFLLCLLSFLVTTPTEDTFLVILHADDRPTGLFRLCQEGVAEGADFRFRAVGELADPIIAVNEHQPRLAVLSPNFVLMLLSTTRSGGIP
jgi:hypothetical protein